ncbi:GD11627 [Drosophila simulans]|uniref:GD11627 n=1 Tax=Drosophila simulans TaxID=7240 RepID=B4QGK8_DROSI|nr:GD11627 [Drosophila simulans]
MSGGNLFVLDANKTEQKLNAFYGVIEEYLDSDTTGYPLRTSIETQLIALCLQRNGFDRWKRTVQTRTAQLEKLI